MSPVFPPTVSLLAQGRSEKEEDHHVLKGRLAESESEIHEVEQLVDGVTASGGRQDLAGEVQCFTHRSQFVLYVPTVEPDSHGRLSMIACHGDLAEPPSRDSLAEAIKSFAAHIRRSVSPEALSGASEALSALKKKSWCKRHAALLAAAAALCVMLLLIWFLTKAAQL